MFPLAALAVGGVYEIADYALGRPMNLWGKQIEASQAPGVRNNVAFANYSNPNIMPPPDAIFEAVRRGLLSWQVAQTILAEQGVLWGGLPFQLGANPWNAGLAADMPQPRAVMLREAWQQIAKMRRSRPEPGGILAAWERNRISRDDWDRLTDGLDMDADLYGRMAQSQYNAPEWEVLWQLKQRGAITAGDYHTWCQRAGWFNSDALSLREQVSAMPTIIDLQNASFRKAITVDEFQRYAKAIGWNDNRALNILLAANRPTPTPSDLIRFAVREVWDDATVRRWDFDAEFPVPFQKWMDYWGMGWGEPFTGPDGTQYPSVPWPKAYWRAHWQIISPTQGHQALRLLRPDQLHRYRELAPDVTAFTPEDLATVLKVSDYPPKMRAWLTAINAVALRLSQIQQIFQSGRRDRNWAINRMMDRGHVREDATAVVEIWEDRQADAQRRAGLLLSRQIARETLAEVRTAYRMGGLSAEDVRARLAPFGLSPGEIQAILNLEDARAARANLQVFLRSMRRSYLTGALSEAEVNQSLTAARLAPPAIARYLRLWQSELGVERRALSTGQLVQAVAAGQLSPAIAAVRLARLGWTDPDAALLIQQAVAKLTHAQALAAKQALHSQQSAAKQVALAQRQAQAVALAAQRQLRRIYPLSTLKRQFCLGIRKGPTISALLESQGYTKDAISALLLEWSQECMNKPSAEQPALANAESLAKRQTPLSTIKAWWQNGVITDAFARARLAAIGLDSGTIELQLKLWQSTLGKKSGPAKG